MPGRRWHAAHHLATLLLLVTVGAAARHTHNTHPHTNEHMSTPYQHRHTHEHQHTHEHPRTTANEHLQTNIHERQHTNNHEHSHTNNHESPHTNNHESPHMNTHEHKSLHEHTSSQEYTNESISDEDYYYYDDDQYDYEDYDYADESPRPLNMSKFHLPGSVLGSSAPHVPRYMLELYADQTSRGPQVILPNGADLVRSFIASTSERELSTESGTEDTDRRHLATRIHNLSFNATLPRGERVVNATLRLYALITRDQYAYIGVERRVSLMIEVRKGLSIDDLNSPHYGRDQLPSVENHPLELVTVSKRDVYNRHNAWETFDVTSAIKYWLSHPDIPQILQIHIDSVFQTAGEGGDMDVATAPNTDSEPLLLLYSSVRRRRQAKQELDLMIEHEYDEEEEEEETKRRRRKRSLHSSRERRNAAEQQEEESNVIWDGELGAQDLPQHAHNSLGGRGRGKRGRRRRAKNGCKKKPLKVDFKEIGWDKWIIAPPEYEANQCSGKCFYPLASHLSPTKHAVVQNLVQSLHPDRTSRACCVPTLLGPISLLYIENGITTYKYDYDDMVVIECGCR